MHAGCWLVEVQDGQLASKGVSGQGGGTSQGKDCAHGCNPVLKTMLA